MRCLAVREPSWWPKWHNADSARTRMAEVYFGLKMWPKKKKTALFQFQHMPLKRSVHGPVHDAREYWSGIRDGWRLRLDINNSWRLLAILWSGSGMAAILGRDSELAAILGRGSETVAILWRGSGVKDITNTGIAILTVGYAGIRGWSSSLASGACPLLPPPKKYLGDVSFSTSPTVKGDSQNCRTKSINSARV